jgi:hypothetical protein
MILFGPMYMLHCKYLLMPVIKRRLRNKRGTVLGCKPLMLLLSP